MFGRRKNPVGLADIFLDAVDEVLQTGTRDPEILDVVRDYILVAFERKPDTLNFAASERPRVPDTAMAVFYLAVGKALQQPQASIDFAAQVDCDWF